MSNEIAKKEQSEIVTQNKLKDYLKSFGLAESLTAQEASRFIEIAQAYNLNPFKREVYCVAYGKGQYRKLSIITGYEVYLKRAERSGKLDGWKAWIEGTGKDAKGIVEIHRKDWSNPFTHEVYFAEVAPYKSDGSLTAFWKKQPRFLLKKVAISQGFRLAFPDELGGMPYTEEEMPNEMTERNVTQEAQVNNNEIEKVIETANDKIDSVIEPEKTEAKQEEQPAKNIDLLKAEYTKLITSKHNNKNIFSEAEQRAKTKVFENAVSKNDTEAMQHLIEIFTDVKDKSVEKLQGGS